MVTVALDVNPEAARPSIERAKPEHPSLIDSAHLLDELLGIFNVPNGMWIDEDGMIVRPAEAAAPERPNSTGTTGFRPRDDMPERLRAMMEEASKIRIDARGYTRALRDWVENGAASPYALSPAEVIERSRSRGENEAKAAAYFELGQHLYRNGYQDRAPLYWREAHRLDPDNWTYKRQAWQLADPFQGPTELYDSDWLADVRKIGAENYYPPLQL